MRHPTSAFGVQKPSLGIRVMWWRAGHRAVREEPAEGEHRCAEGPYIAPAGGFGKLRRRKMGGANEAVGVMKVGFMILCCNSLNTRIFREDEMVSISLFFLFFFFFLKK
jgi:hypothetical protein